MAMLLHACCGPCSCYTTEWLLNNGFEPTLYYYNPNIHPYLEYQRRLEGLQQLAEIRQLPLIVESGYELEYFLREVAQQPEFRVRCLKCYEMRLRKTAEKAVELGFDTFSTTLLISPYQNRQQICEIGHNLAREHQLTFIDEDYSVGFRRSQELAKEYGIYRQPYCGCIYSEKDRYYKEKNQKAEK